MVLRNTALDSSLADPTLRMSKYGNYEGVDIQKLATSLEEVPVEQDAASHTTLTKKTVQDIITHPPLLGSSLSSLVSYILLPARVSLKMMEYVTDLAFEGAKAGVSTSLLLYRSLIVGALTTAQSIHQKVYTRADMPFDTHYSVPEHSGMFHRILDHYTHLSVTTVHHGFSLAELFTLATFHMTNKTVKLSLGAAHATVHTIDGLFGSTETSRALSAFVDLVRKEINHQQESQQASSGGLMGTLGTILMLGSLSKALTAFACLQYMTHRKTSLKQHLKLKSMYEGLVHTPPPSHSTLPQETNSTGQEPLLITSFEKKDPDSHSQYNVKWWAEKDDVTTIEIEETVQDDEQEPLDPLYIMEASDALRREMDVLNDPEDLVKDAAESKRRHSNGSQDTSAPSHSQEFMKTASLDFSSRPLEELMADSSLSFMKHPVISKAKSQSLRDKISQFGKFPRNKKSVVATSKGSFKSHFRHAVPDEGVDTLQKAGEKPGGLLMMFDSTSTVEQDAKGIKKRRSTIRMRPSMDTIHYTPNTQDQLLPIQKPEPSNLVVSQQHPLRQLQCFPLPHLLHNIDRFVRFSSGAYGKQFMQILGIGKVRDLETSDEQHPEDASHYAFSLHTGVPLNCISMSFHTQQEVAFDGPRIKPIRYYVVDDKASQCAVLVFRGTLGLSDVLIDLMCEYADVTIDHQDYKVHSGMLRAAQYHADTKSPVLHMLSDILSTNPDYGLVLTGHSLGAGVAGMLSILWSQKLENGDFVTSESSGLPPGRTIHCYAYGSPCIVSESLSRYSAGLVTSIIHGDDFVPCISIGHVRDLRRAAVHLLDHNGLPEHIIGRSMGLYRNASTLFSPSIEDEDWFWETMLNVRQSMDSEKLFPPGNVYWIKSASAKAQVNTEKGHTTIETQRVQMHHCQDVVDMFSEPRFSKRMITDHSPGSYEETIQVLLKSHFLK